MELSERVIWDLVTKGDGNERAAKSGGNVKSFEMFDAISNDIAEH